MTARRQPLRRAEPGFQHCGELLRSAQRKVGRVTRRRFRGTPGCRTRGSAAELRRLDQRQTEAFAHATPAAGLRIRAYSVDKLVVIGIVDRKQPSTVLRMTRQSLEMSAIDAPPALPAMQRACIDATRPQPLERIEHQRVVLARLDRADHEHGACASSPGALASLGTADRRRRSRSPRCRTPSRGGRRMPRPAHSASARRRTAREMHTHAVAATQRLVEPSREPRAPLLRRTARESGRAGCRRPRCTLAECAPNRSNTGSMRSIFDHDESSMSSVSPQRGSIVAGDALRRRREALRRAANRSPRPRAPSQASPRPRRSRHGPSSTSSARCCARRAGCRSGDR